jgi:hypothetical protein
MIISYDKSIYLKQKCLPEAENNFSGEYSTAGV